MNLSKLLILLNKEYVIMNIKYLPIIFIAVICLMIPLCANAEKESDNDNYEIVMVMGEATETTTSQESTNLPTVTTTVDFNNPPKPGTDDDTNDSSLTTPTKPSGEFNPSLSIPQKLMVYCSMSVKTEPGAIFITAKTQGDRQLDAVGFKQFQIQRSSDGNEWETEKILDEMVKTNAKQYSIDSYKVQVQGGYYYRVLCTHYASNNKGEHKLDNISSYEWIDTSVINTPTEPDADTTVSENTVISNTAIKPTVNLNSQSAANELLDDDNSSKNNIEATKANGSEVKSQTADSFHADEKSTGAEAKSSSTKTTGSTNSSKISAAVNSPKTYDKGAAGSFAVLLMFFASAFMLRKKDK